jgi:SanA protein
MKIKIILLTFFIGFIAFIVYSNYRVINQTKDQIYADVSSIPFREYGLVLGTSKSAANGINLYFQYRLDAAIDLYNQKKINKILVSGDNRIKGYDEPTDMANYLIEHGIPSEDIIKDFAGFRTLDSVVRAKKVFKCQDITIISQEFHTERALYIANYYKMNAVGFAATNPYPKRSFSKFREYFAKCLVILDLHVWNRQPKFL